MHIVRSVITGYATTAVVWGVDDVVVLEGKTPRARSITASKTTTAEASLDADMCHYFVVSWSNFQECDVGCSARDWQTSLHLYVGVNTLEDMMRPDRGGESYEHSTG
jgi:hypothetical protein